MLLLIVLQNNVGYFAERKIKKKKNSAVAVHGVQVLL